MIKEDTLTIDGTVDELLAGAQFKVTLINGMRVIAHLSGKMWTKNIRIAIGDTVTVEMSPYDLTKARIIRRQK
jgi:translation initiation factor IF-1